MMRPYFSATSNFVPLTMNSRHGSRLLGLPSEDIVMKKARALELPAERLTGVVGCSVCRCAVPVYCSRKSERAAAGAGAVLLVSLLLRLVLPKRPGELLVNCGCSGSQLLITIHVP